MRIPGWCRSATATAADEALAATPGEYLEIRRSWQPGEKIVVDLPMPVELLVANPMATETRDSVTVKRGPIVYCFEAIDNPEMRCTGGFAGAAGGGVTGIRRGIPR